LRTTPGCSEEKTQSLAGLLAAQLKPGDRVFLEGELGAGKTTFARAVLAALRVDQPAEGSPTFAIAHEYRYEAGEVVHVDFYRLKYEAEIEEAGLPEYFWGRNAVVLCEWISLFAKFRDAVLADAKRGRSRVYRVNLAMVPGKPELRDVRID
jgi:tRNA threonylcarbamoyl adenosine modification protein YjeE